jgi:hypothetical protein
MAAKELDQEGLLMSIKEVLSVASGGDLSVVKDLKRLLKTLKAQGVDDDILGILEKRIALTIEQEYELEKIIERQNAEYNEEQQTKNDEAIAAIRQEVVKQARTILEATELIRNKNALEAIRLQKEIDYLMLQIQSLRTLHQQLDEEHKKNLAQIQLYDLQLEESCHRVIGSDYVEKLQELNPSVSKQAIEDYLRKSWADPNKTERDCVLGLAGLLKSDEKQIAEINAGSTVYQEESDRRKAVVKSREVVETNDQRTVVAIEVVTESERQTEIDLASKCETQKGLLKTVAEQTGQLIATVTAKIEEIAVEAIVAEAPDRVRMVEEELAEIKEKLPAERKEVEDINRAIEQVDEEIEEIKFEMDVADDAEIPDLEKQKTLKERERDGLKEKCDKLKPRITQHEIRVRQLTSEIELLKSPPEEITSRLQEADIVSPQTLNPGNGRLPGWVKDGNYSAEITQSKPVVRADMDPDPDDKRGPHP